MSIGEVGALLGDPVDIRGRDPGVPVKTGQIAVSHVIGKNVDDVGLIAPCESRLHQPRQGKGRSSHAYALQEIASVQVSHHHTPIAFER